MTAPELVDSQVHIWPANTSQTPWPAARARFHHGPPSYGAEDIVRDLDRAGISRAVLVPAICAGDDNRFALQSAGAYPSRLKVFGRMAMTDPLAQERLAEDISLGMAGSRLTFLEADAPHLGDGTLDWFWDFAESNQHPVMVFAPTQAETIAAIARKHPSLRLAVDHMGLQLGGNLAIYQDDVTATLALADLPNVSVKVTPYAWFGDEPFPFRNLLGLSKRLVDGFGPERIFWGADHTRLLPCDYGAAASAFLDHFPWENESERDLVMGQSILRWLGWR